MIDASSLIGILIYIIIIGCVFGLLWWLVGYIGLPEPFNKVARVVLAVIAVLFLISILLSFIGHPVLKW